MTATSGPPANNSSAAPPAAPARGRWRRITLVVVAVLFLAIQLVPVRRTNPPVTVALAWDSPRTEALARRACMDCHSNETRWPWYAYVAPTSWLTFYDVVRGRRGLNLSEFTGDDEDEGFNPMARRPTDLAYRLGQLMAGGGARRGGARPGAEGGPPPAGAPSQFGGEPGEGQFPAGGRPRDTASQLRENIEEGDMPPGKYVLMHPDAKLTSAERQELLTGLLATLGLSAR